MVKQLAVDGRNGKPRHVHSELGRQRVAVAGGRQWLMIADDNHVLAARC